jgi:hypothetical protein
VTDTFEDSLGADPIVDGQVEDQGLAELDAPVLDLSEYSDHYVTVKVDGEEVRVPLSEAVAGYSRQADYTRKTQELASQKQELQWASAIRQALESDPASTLDLLSNHYGISRRDAQQMVEDDPFLTDFGIEDPVDKRLQEIDRRVSAFEQVQAQQRLEEEISRLQTKYGEDFDPQEVVSAAIGQGNTNLEAVFKQVAFDRVSARRSAETERATKATEAKRAASVVSGATSARTAKDEVGPVKTIADAWAAAKRQHGVS